MKKQKIVCLIIVLMAGLNMNIIAQPNLLWAKGMGGPGVGTGTSVAVDASGNVYTTGYFQGTVDFDPSVAVYTLAAIGSADVYVSKLDASGNFVWAKCFGGLNADLSYDIALDASGNVYTTGLFKGTADFDPGVSTYTLIPAGVGTTGDVFISKLDASGNFVWARQMGGPTLADDNGTSITIDALGNVYTTGYYSGIGDFDPGAGTFNLTSAGANDIFVSKLNSSGIFVWAKSMGGAQADIPYSIATDLTGNVYTTGLYSSVAADFDPGAGVFTLSNFGLEDVFISKLDPTGAFIWAKRLGGAGNNIGRSVSVDGSGNVYTSGYYNGTADFDPGAAVFNLTSAGGDDIYISKLNSAGNFVWAKSIGSIGIDHSFATTLDATGNIYYAGSFNNTVDFDPNPGIFNLTSAGGDDAFIGKLDPSGAFVWAANFGSPGGELVNGLAINNTCGYVFSTGYFGGATDFDPGPGTNILTPVGSGIFVAKLFQTPPPTVTASGSTTFCPGGSVILTSSPATLYMWNTGATTPSINITAAGNYWVNVFGGGCQGVSSVIVVTVPVTTITVNSGTICPGINFTFTPSGAVTYTYSGGSAVVNPTTTTTYSVIGTNTFGCISTSPAIGTVAVLPSPSLTIATSNTLLCLGNAVTLTGSGALTYTWTGIGSTNPLTDTPLTTTSYTLSGTNSFGCTDSIVFVQVVSACTDIKTLLQNSELFNIYPNPVVNELHVETFIEESRLEIYSAFGTLLYDNSISKGNSSINLEKFSAGLYFIRLGNKTIKIIKE